MSINAISASMAASSYSYFENIPQRILSKLVELGIDASEVTSVSQAKSLIERAEKSKEEQGAENSFADDGENPDLRQRAVDLAEKIGVQVKDTDTVDDIIDNIKDALDMAMKVAVNRNDEALYNTLKGYRQELDEIVAENNGGGVSNAVVYSFMDMVAKQNKYALGLDKN